MWNRWANGERFQERVRDKKLQKVYDAARAVQDVVDTGDDRSRDRGMPDGEALLQFCVKSDYIGKVEQKSSTSQWFSAIKMDIIMIVSRRAVH